MVQLYQGAPVIKLDKHVKELKGVVKTGLLQPGQKQVVTCTIINTNLASFNEGFSTRYADKGVYDLYIGSSSSNIELKTSCTLANDLVVRKVNNVLAPK